MFAKKVLKYGIRRSFTYLTITAISRARVFAYRYFLSDNKPNFSKAKIKQPTQFIGKGKIKIFKSVLGVWPSPYLFSGSGYIEARSEQSTVSIGENTFINNNFVIIADKTSIKIGCRCLIGPNVFITDSDFHGLTMEDRKGGKYQAKSTVIADYVFIGEGAKILKGVSVGTGSVIASGSVVVSDVEAHCVYAGNPAKLVKRFEID